MSIVYIESRLESLVNKVIKKILNRAKIDINQLKMRVGLYKDIISTLPGKEKNGAFFPRNELECYKDDISSGNLKKIEENKDIESIILIDERRLNDPLKAKQLTIAHELRHAIQYEKNELAFRINTMLDIIDNEKGLKNEKPFEADARNFAERIINNSVSNKYKWLKGTKTIFKQRKNEIESFKINDGIWKCIWEKNYLRYKQLLKNNEGTL